MVFNIIVVLLPILSLIYAALSGSLPALSSAVVEGAHSAVTLCLSICGLICFWQAVMEVMRQSGLADGLSRLLRPVLKKLFPTAASDRDTMNALTANVSANLLGLGNAATPAGINAAKGLQRLSGHTDASDELCLLVVMNTASIQLIPTTVASLRAALGAQSPFDILPAVWLCSACSVTAGLCAAKLFERLSKR
ncbi:MAG: spore maturation protein A [Clostridiales bacterium]|jgi:spore maturation protein A|nr:spore maturation protein A [Clostridiales bacterium]